MILDFGLSNTQFFKQVEKMNKTQRTLQKKAPGENREWLLAPHVCVHCLSRSLRSNASVWLRSRDLKG
jgi:hypothetical protein